MSIKSSTKIIKHGRAETKANVPRRIPNFEGVSRKAMPNAPIDDIHDALAFLEYLSDCLSNAALRLPGGPLTVYREARVRPTPAFEFHCADRAYCFVNEYLFEAARWCQQRLEELEKTATCAR